MSELDLSRTHPDVQSALVEAGWHPGRRTDITDWVEELAPQGHQLSDLASAVLTTLGGLTIAPVNETGPNFSNDEPFSVDPIDAGSGHRELGVEIERELGGSYYPVGEWLSYSSVFVEAGGRVIATGLGWLWELGETFEDALELAVRAHRPLVCVRVLAPGADPWPPQPT